MAALSRLKAANREWEYQNAPTNIMRNLMPKTIKAVSKSASPDVFFTNINKNPNQLSKRPLKLPKQSPEDAGPFQTLKSNGNFVWTPANVAKWTGSNLASGVVGSIGGMVFGKLLDAIGLGEPNLAAMLTDISNRMIGIENDVRYIKQITEQILAELRELRVSMDQSFLEGPLKEAFAKINAAYGTPAPRRRAQGGVIAPSMMEITVLAKTKNATQMKPYLEAFQDASQSVWQVRNQIFLIHDVLAATTGHGTTVVEAWADGLILAVKNRKLSLVAASRTLEGYFMQAVGKQVTAAAIHCFALGDDESRVNYFMKTEVGDKMRNQTNEYLRCIEKLVFSGTVIKKVPSNFTMQESEEFNSDAEAILLRADLVCAALNLVSNERKVSLKDAISGAYGRVLARKSDMGADGKGPKMTLPTLPWIHGQIVGKIDNLRVVDLTRSGTKLDLADFNDSAPTMIRYYWPWESKPTSGRPLEPVFRGGVTPAFFDVFEDKDAPLAAGFLDFRTMLVGAPVGSRPTLTTNSVFAGWDKHCACDQKLFVPYSPHPLVVRPPKGANMIEWTFAHAWKGDGNFLRSSAFHLFNYKGKAPAKLRLTVNVYCSVEHKPRCPTWGDNDVNARIALVKPDNSKIPFYNSEHEGDGRLYLIHRRGNYKSNLDSWHQLDIDLTEGEYSLSLDFKNWIGSRTMFENYKGWNNDSLHFELNGVWLEWI
jgi:hypothetical protein